MTSDARAVRPRVLVVDDNEINRRIAEMQLRSLGADVAHAPGGQAALDMLAAAPYDLVLLDGMMPGMDGPATAREIRRRERAADVAPIPVIALTASAMPEDRDRMLEAGMDDHVVKPLTARELGTTLDRWIGRDGGRTHVIAPLPSVLEGSGRRPAGQPVRAAPPVVAPDGQAAPSPWAPAVAGGAELMHDAVIARLLELGEPSLGQRIVRLFLADAGGRVAQVEVALAGGDLVAAGDALRALEGLCGMMGATALDRHARALRASFEAPASDVMPSAEARPRDHVLRTLYEATQAAIQSALDRRSGR